MAIEKQIEEQVLKWQKSTDRRKKKNEPPGPVITISREPGSGGEALAKMIAEELKIDYFDRKIVQEVARSARMSEKVVASLDEKERGLLDNWIQFLRTSRYFWPDEFVHHLTKVLNTVCQHGNALIVGRAANMVLPPEETLRIRFVAPLEYRVESYAKEIGLSKEEAQKKIAQEESDRKSFVQKYFHVDIDDTSYYDLVINTRYYKPEQILEAVKALLKFKKMPARRRFDPKPEEA